MESRSFGSVDDRFTVPSVRMGGSTERLFVDRMFCDDVGEDIMVDIEKDPELGSERGITGRISEKEMWGCSSVARLAI